MPQRNNRAVNGRLKFIIERGECVEERRKTIGEFFATNVLNVNSNVQFGEGWAVARNQ